MQAIIEAAFNNYDEDENNHDSEIFENLLTGKRQQGIIFYELDVYSLRQKLLKSHWTMQQDGRLEDGILYLYTPDFDGQAPVVDLNRLQEVQSPILPKWVNDEENEGKVLTIPVGGDRVGGVSLLIDFEEGRPIIDELVVGYWNPPSRLTQSPAIFYQSLEDLLNNGHRFALATGNT